MSTSSILPGLWLVNGYHNITETYGEMQNIAGQYPSIARFYDLSVMFPLPSSQPQVTWEGRHIYALKISDNPQVNESEEPEVLYMGLHHAREWISVEVCLSIMHTLTSQYSVDMTIRGYVDDNEIWIVPIVNPDGLQYSQYTSTMWRKNRRDNGGGIFGVDLNRNYGYKWGYNNVGSSPSPSNNLYRGPAPFSEPETRIVRDLVESRDFVSAITFHSYGEDILYPWGYVAADTAHHELFAKLAQEMVLYNNYDHGNHKSGIIYETNGDYLDWAYGNLTNIAFTFELGTQFIPPASQIPSINSANTNAAFVLLKYARNPWEVFASGIQGSVKNSSGAPIPGTTITTEIMGETYSCTTNVIGQYTLHFPPGNFQVSATKPGYTTDTKYAIPVVTNTYTLLDLVIDDIFPPAVKSVTSLVEDTGTPYSDGIYDIGSLVNITVTEWEDEVDLVGTLEIASLSSGYYMQPRSLEMHMTSWNNASYYFLWDTTGMVPGDDYVVEARLGDHAANWDLDGSNNLGPDHIIALVDMVPPEIVDVDSKLLSGVEVLQGEVYEIGSMVNITVTEKDEEPGLTGDVVIVSTSTGYDSGPIELQYDPVGSRYWTLWDTTGLVPGIDYGVESTLSDASENADLDGLPSTPDLSIALQDTTPPEVEWVDSHVLDDTDERYEIDSIVTLIVKEERGERGLEGSIEIAASGVDYNWGPIPLQECLHDGQPGTYLAIWNTTGLVPHEAYQVEVKLKDPYGNIDDDGSEPDGADLIIALVDSIHPEIALFDSQVEGDRDERYECGSKVTLVVAPEQWEEGLSCIIEIASSGSGYASGKIQLNIADGGGSLAESSIGHEDLQGRRHFFAVWDTTELPLGDCTARALLSDRNGNPSAPVDLIITLEDTVPPPCVEDLQWSREDEQTAEITLRWKNPDPEAIILVYRDYLQFDEEPSDYHDHLMLISPTVLEPDTGSMEDAVLPDVTVHYLILTEDLNGNRNNTLTSGNYVAVLITPPPRDMPEDVPTNESDEEDNGSMSPVDDEELQSSPSISHNRFPVYVLMAVLLCIALVLIGFLYYKRRSRKEEEEDEEEMEEEDGSLDAVEPEVVSPSEIVSGGDIQTPDVGVGVSGPSPGLPGLPAQTLLAAPEMAANTIGTLPPTPAARDFDPAQDALPKSETLMLPKH